MSHHLVSPFHSIMNLLRHQIPLIISASIARSMKLLVDPRHFYVLTSFLIT